jgi:putative (di)nucleoside polyphosphate hydrolase
VSNRAKSSNKSAAAAPGRALPYRAGIGLMLFNRAGHVFVARRIDMQSNAWQMPQGGIDAGETPRAAALRELKEEVGTDKAKIVAESRGWYRYDLPPELQGWVWGGRYRGQRQRWFALRFYGGDDDIDIHTKHAEFSAWRWTPIATLPRLIVPFKRDLYVALIDEFGHLATAW